MLIKTPGIVIRTTKYAESSVVARIYTRQLGIQTYMINGVRGPKAAVKPSLLQPLILLEMVTYHKPGRQMHRIKELKPSPLLAHLHFDVIKCTVGMFAAELINKTVKEEEPDEGLYDFLEGYILELDRAQHIALFPLYLVVQLSRFLGFFPLNEPGSKSTYFLMDEGVFAAAPSIQDHTIGPPLSSHLAQLIHAGMDDLPQIKIPQQDRVKLMLALMEYYRLHVQGFQSLRSLQVLDGLFR